MKFNETVTKGEISKTVTIRLSREYYMYIYKN
jgi:ribosomal protein S17